MLLSTHLFTGDKFKRFLGPEDGKGTSRNEQSRNSLLKKLQKLKELFAKLLRSGENQSGSTSFEIEPQEKPKSPKEIMAAILGEIKNQHPDMIRLGIAIRDMEIYLARGCYSDGTIASNVTIMNKWLAHVTKKRKIQHSC